MSEVSSIIGREREIAQLDLSIGPGRDGLRIAMLSGPSGLGKTTLATIAADRAAARGFRVANIRGRAGSLSTPFAPFIEAMPEFEVLLSVLAGDQSIDIEHAGIGLVNLVAELVNDSPLLLVVDDAQALDESSIALLPFLSGVSERVDLSLLFVEQTDAIGIPSSYRSYVDGLLARRVVGHLALGPMSDDLIRTLVARELELVDEADVPKEIVDRAAGNPWFAKELAHGWNGANDEIPGSISAAATSRLHSLDDVGQDIVSAIALCTEGAHIGWLEALSGQRPRHFVRTMEAIQASGLVREDGEILTIAHPLMQQALVDELSSAMRRAIHLELADAIAVAPLAEAVSERALGTHLSEAGRADDAVAHFTRAADANELHGQLHEAYADLVRALDAEPRIEHRRELLVRCATMAVQVDRDAAERYWVELGRIAAAQGQDELQAYALFQQYWTCNDGRARDRLERAAVIGVDRVGWSARAAANLASLDGDFAAAERHDTCALDIARDNGDGMLEALATHRLGVTLGALGRMSESVTILRQAVQLAIAGRHHAWAVAAWADLAESLALELRVDEAVSESRSAIRYVEDLGLDRMRPMAIAWHASAVLRAGDLEAAAGLVADAMSAAASFPVGDQYSPFIAYLRAELANERGDSNAAELTTAAIDWVDRLGYASWRDQLRIQEARVAARSGNLDAALPALDALSNDEPSMLAEAASWLLRTSVLASFEPGVERVRQLASALDHDAGEQYVRLVRREIDATLAALGGASVAPISAIAEEWERGGRALDAMRLIAVAGAIEFTRGERSAAQVLLKSAKAGLQGCGASADADIVSALLRQTGARSRAKSRTTNVGPLTKRELEIARLVASGLKNSEVASTLFLAEKTVAAHLSNIYGKVEVRSRVQLTAWIRENDPEFEAGTLASA